MQWDFSVLCLAVFFFATLVKDPFFFHASTQLLVPQAQERARLKLRLKEVRAAYERERKIKERERKERHKLQRKAEKLAEKASKKK